jgi:hypothetical protein
MFFFIKKTCFLQKKIFFNVVKFNATLKKKDKTKVSGAKKSFLLDFGYVESVGSV